MTEITYRAGALADSYSACRVFYLTIRDFARRRGMSSGPAEEDEAGVAGEWQNLRSLYQHLAENCEHFVVAESGGEMIGYARSILRDGVRELTEFFVLPGRQSAGVGRTLLEKVFPAQGAQRRVIIATLDLRAQVRYLKAGVYPRFPIINFSRVPRSDAGRGTEIAGLGFAPIGGSAADFDALREIDRAILGYTRDADHHFFQQERRGFLVYQQGRLEGYGYAGYDGGPLAVLAETNFPAVLAYTEEQAAEMADRFHIEVPMINRAAVDYLLSSGYEMSDFIALFMSDSAWGKFENYILPAPPFCL